jgi:hypothetical protein
MTAADHDGEHNNVDEWLESLGIPPPPPSPGGYYY